MKDLIRDLQERTGRHLESHDRWSHSFAVQLVRALGYEYVSEAIANSSNLRLTTHELNEQMRDHERRKRDEKLPR